MRKTLAIFLIGVLAGIALTIGAQDNAAHPCVRIIGDTCITGGK